MSIFLEKEPKSANFTQFPKFKKEIKKVFVLNGGYKAWRRIGGKQSFGLQKSKYLKYKCKKVRKHSRGNEGYE